MHPPIIPERTNSYRNHAGSDVPNQHNLCERPGNRIHEDKAGSIDHQELDPLLYVFLVVVPKGPVLIECKHVDEDKSSRTGASDEERQLKNFHKECKQSQIQWQRRPSRDAKLEELFGMQMSPLAPYAKSHQKTLHDSIEALHADRVHYLPI